MKQLSVEGEEKIVALLRRAFDIYNAFGPGPEGEEKLLKLRDEIRGQMDAGADEETPITVTLPLGLTSFMMAASKHLGDMCMAISQMGKEGVLFEGGRGKRGRGGPPMREPKRPTG